MDMLSSPVRPCDARLVGAPALAYNIASSTRSVSVAGSGQDSFAAAARSRVSATVLRAMPSERAIARSLAPPSYSKS